MVPLMCGIYCVNSLKYKNSVNGFTNFVKFGTQKLQNYIKPPKLFIYEKIILLILLSFISFAGFAQDLNEGFEEPATADAAGVWALPLQETGW
jgi:hypothetical protein